MITIDEYNFRKSSTLLLHCLVMLHGDSEFTDFKTERYPFLKIFQYVYVNRKLPIHKDKELFPQIF